MASIYSDEMKEKILADFSSKNPKVSASIIERFGENPRNKGIGSLNVEQYRDAVDAPLYMQSGGSSGGGFKEWISGGDEEAAPGFSDVLGLLKALSGLFAGDIKPPVKAPKYRAPKTRELEGMGTIGMAYGGKPEQYAGGGLISGLGNLLQFISPFLNELLISKYIDKDDEDEDMAEGMNDGGTVLNRKLFLGGGEVDGIGGERDDLVPIWASDREYVVSANGVRRMGGGNHARGIAALDEINNDGRLV